MTDYGPWIVHTPGECTHNAPCEWVIKPKEE